MDSDKPHMFGLENVVLRRACLTDSVNRELSKRFQSFQSQSKEDLESKNVNLSEKFDSKFCKKPRPRSDSSLQRGERYNTLIDGDEFKEESLTSLNVVGLEKNIKFGSKVRPISDITLYQGRYNKLHENPEECDSICKNEAKVLKAKEISEEFNTKYGKKLKLVSDASINQGKYIPLSENLSSYDDKCFVLNDLTVRFVKAKSDEENLSGLENKFNKSRPGHPSTGLNIIKCCGHVLLLGCGGIALFVGLLLGIAWPFLFYRLLQNELALKLNSTTLSMWRETPLPMYMDVYMFNWTNYETSIRGPDKPNFVELGPYVFYEHHTKGNMVWNSNNTITYQNKKTWKFMPEMSNGSLSDKITNLNVVAMTVGDKCRYIGRYMKVAANIFISMEEVSLAVTNTVEDLLFNGCQDRLLTLADKLKEYIKTPLPYDKFGWFYKRNESFTSDGVFVMNTGTDDINKLGLLTQWNYKNVTGCYKDDCAKVQGTIGELFPPVSATSSDIQLFANDLCSVLKLKADQNVVVGNLTGTLFKGMDMFDNHTSCYCEDGNCPPSGVRNVSSCKGAPAFISLPHFYNADPSYRQAITGMNPDPEKHSFEMVLEQVTSTPLKVRARLQLNILMDTVPGMNFYSNLKKTYIPMLWFNQRADITPVMAQQLSSLADLSFYAPFVMFGFATIGGIFITLGLFFRSRSCCQEQDERLLD